MVKKIAPAQSGETGSEALKRLVWGVSFLLALAFAAGLYVQAGAGLVPSAIGGMVIWLALAAVQTVFYGRLPDNLDARMDRLETAIVQLTDDVEELEALQASLAAFQKLAPQIERLEGLFLDGLEDADAAMDVLKREAEQTAEQGKKIDRLASQLTQLDRRLEDFRRNYDTHIRRNAEKLRAELQMMETLIKQLAEQMAAQGSLQAASALKAADSTKSPPRSAGISKKPMGLTGEAPRPPAKSASEKTSGKKEETDMLDVVRHCIEADKIDLYLQPIVNLPYRKTLYYEALTRLRGEDGQVIMPADYIDVAESAGIMPLIDNVLLFRSVQVMRRLNEFSRARGLFCNISVYSLLDPEFFPEFIAFLENNNDLAKSLVFEFGQDMVSNFGPMEEESLAALARLGFHFSLDRISTLDIDFKALHEKGFRYVKVDSAILLHRMAEAKAQIHPADMHELLARCGLTLIAEKVEDERSASRLVSYSVPLAQGYLFAEPRPVRPEVFAPRGGEAA